jgi:hypothetical protein
MSARRQPEAGAERLPTRLLLVVLAAALFAACFGDATPKKDEPAPTQIDESWTWNRRSPGHSTHLAAKLKCEDCHQLGTAELAVATSELCQKCHADRALHHAGIDALAGQKLDFHDCVACHRFAQDEPPAGMAPLGIGGDSGFAAPDDCLSCHRDAQGKHEAVVIHADQPCLSCHQPHGATGLEAPDCTSCHESVHLAHGKRSSDGRPGFEQCLDCHRPHSPAAVAGDACPTCHFNGEPRIPTTATFAGGHEHCNGCHQTHDLRNSAAASCTTCHEDHGALSSGRVAAHQQCTNCHDQHNVRQAAHDACAKCHQTAHNDHPATRGALGPCVTCHNPHPDKAGQARSHPSSCVGCHSEPHKDKGHGNASLDCTACHKPHGFVSQVKSPALCATCHAEQAGKASHNKGHTACSNCHADLPHHPKDGSTDCKSCHQDHAGASKVHGACLTCHEPHGGTQSKACLSCHQTEHRSAPVGHQACTSCHEPHHESPRTPQKACATCHAAEAKNNPHLGMANGCQTCHQPHGPAGNEGPLGPAHPPACSSCHQQAKLPSLHAQAGHDKCTSCHSPHDKNPRRDRASCLGCHQDRKDHQPQADNCASCHLFRAPNTP